MNRKYFVAIISVAVAALGIIGGWNISSSECERLSKENYNEKAFPICITLAQQGNAYAQNIVGVSYASGDGVAQDSEAALLWFRKSATQGFAKAQSNIAIAYLDGNGVKRNHSEANRWWKLAAAQGEPHAQFNLAVSYANGYGVNQDSGIAESLMLDSFLSFLKAGDFSDASKSAKYIRIHWPWSELNTTCSLLPA